ncbi:glutathione-dependent formaldehyde-activating enzyme [Jackrogersella minutella]|nr:glutathione-dependent formaldehyde-activating enzyme [Jackrogersella minutella]
MAEQLKTFRGNCHCGAYVYEVKLPEKFGTTDCNCSSCYKKGALWVVPKNEDLHFVKGDVDTLTNYTFGRKTFNHKFCSNCGVQLMIVGHIDPPKPGEVKEPMTGINVRTFQYGQGVNVWDIERTPLDGKSFGAPYEPAKFTGPEPTAEIEGAKVYTGSCHCGAVRVALKSKPLTKDSKDSIMECSCSICNRHGSVWLYPKKNQVVIEGKENLGVYLFNTKVFGKTFCKICGIPVHNEPQPISEERMNELEEGQRNFLNGSMDIEPINLRLFDDLNVNDLNVAHYDGYNKNPSRYVEP